MHVKIKTEAVHEGERIGAGSVIDVTEDTYEANKSWMNKAEGEPLENKPASKKKAAPEDAEPK